MYYKKYVGERIYLSPMCADDYQTYTKWVNDETLARGVGNFGCNITELSEKEWIENVCKSGSHNYSIVRLEDDVLLGTYSLEVRNSIAGRYHVGGFIGEIDERSKGYGTEAFKINY